MPKFFHSPVQPCPNRRTDFQAHNIIELPLSDRTLTAKVTVNRRAKRFILKVDPVAGIVHITSPTKRGIPDAITFAKANENWIRRELTNAVCARPFLPDVHFPFLDRTLKICHQGVARTRLIATDDNRLLVGGDRAHINRRVTDWLKKQARSRLTMRADYYAERLGKCRGRLSVRDTRTRWGSCSSDGSLSFSWRLIFAPAEIFDYVVAHECAHLVHLNHSPQFWQVVASLDVDAQYATRWFEKNGAALHGWGVATSPS